jgi:hypothetical protein
MEIKCEAMNVNELEIAIELCIREMARKDYKRCRRLIVGLAVDLADDKIEVDKRL